MNEEIKEILEIFKQVDLEPEAGGCYNCPKKDKDKTCIGCLNNAKDKLLDYITNLQQENERLKEDLIGQENLAITFSKTSHIYYQRIEKAVEYIRQYDGCITGWYYSKEHKRFLAEDNVKDDLLNILNGRSDE